MIRMLACLGMAPMVLAGWTVSGADILTGRYSMAVAADPTSPEFLLSWSSNYDEFDKTGCSQYVQSGAMSADDGISYSLPVCIGTTYNPRTTLVFPFQGSDSSSGYLISYLDFTNRLFQGLTADLDGTPITAEYNLSGVIFPDGISTVVTPSNTTLLFYYWSGDFLARQFRGDGEPGNEIKVSSNAIWSDPSVAVIGNLTGEMLSVAYTGQNSVRMMFFNTTSEAITTEGGEAVVLELVARTPGPSSYSYERAVVVTHPVGIFVVYCGSRYNKTQFKLFGKLFKPNGYTTVASFEFASDINSCYASYSVVSLLDTVVVAWATGVHDDATISVQMFQMTADDNYRGTTTSVYRREIGAKVMPRLAMMNGYQDRVLVVWNGGHLLLTHSEDTKAPDTEIPITALPTSVPPPQSPSPSAVPTSEPNPQSLTPSPSVTDSPIQPNTQPKDDGDNTVLIVIIVTAGIVSLSALIVFIWYQLRKSKKFRNSQYSEMGTCDPGQPQTNILLENPIG
eukprot:TRINITY_DN9013_c0_g3_i1.p1 TRINITY_DN9013_c0_g3~~TRINITY_DN9013_c0_g3_i1.p1  ORF type:complete len:532 (+),score=79.11 TRINITY_DN9013_c0_g3_i1:71-1597(+)